MLLNTVIDDELLQQARQVSGLTTPRELVESALRLLIQLNTPPTTTIDKAASLKQLLLPGPTLMVAECQLFEENRQWLKETLDWRLKPQCH